MQTIVVGVDGSEGSLKALRFAAQEAAAHSARLRIVSAWSAESLPPATWLVNMTPVSEIGVWQQLLEQTARHAAEVAAQAAEEAKEISPSVESEQVVLEGHPAKVLLDEAKDALLLVVGSRGRGTFSEILMGSVSHEVVQHSRVPVVVVP
jgi:nucleotide-binding universal stress UspA family protein